jgi:two-component system, NarL family, nitrate/nitrite response regulator NarL
MPKRPDPDSRKAGPEARPAKRRRPRAGSGASQPRGRRRASIRPRVLIVEDHKLFADALRPVLTKMGMEVMDTAPDAARALAVIGSERPDVVLVDLGLPDIGGIDVGKEILRQRPETKVLALTALNDPRAVREALQAGFHGYLTKDTPLLRFVNAIEASLEGQVVIPHTLASAAAGRRAPEEQYADMVRQHLTPREYEVLALLVEGANTKTMAVRLGLSPNTIRTHVQNILEKLQVGSRLEAAAFAVRHQLIGHPPDRDYGYGTVPSG